MVEAIGALTEIADRYDAIVFDQFGVLHDGHAAYPGAVECLEMLHRKNMRLAVLSNSGKRASPNAERIAAMGFAKDQFDAVMTSGEALWQDMAAGRVTVKSLLAIERAAGDAAIWASGLEISLVDRLDGAEAVLVMGLPDDAGAEPFAELRNAIVARGLPVLCTNPDRASPRHGGALVRSPGWLAHDLARRGATVSFYGKPHLPVFRAVERALDVPPNRLLMIGDSLEHDVSGAAAAGWTSVFVRGGLHAAAFEQADDPLHALNELAAAEAAPLPTFTLQSLGT